MNNNKNFLKKLNKKNNKTSKKIENLSYQLFFAL